MNILIETNKMLREEKDRLEQELQQIQAKVSTELHKPFRYSVYELNVWIYYC